MPKSNAQLRKYWRESKAEQRQKETKGKSQKVKTKQ